MCCICMPRLGAPGFHAGNPPHTSNVCIMDSGSHCAGEICVSRRVSKIMWKEPPSWCLFCLHPSLRCMRVRGCAHGDFARRCCEKAGSSLESMPLIRCQRGCKRVENAIIIRLEVVLVMHAACGCCCGHAAIGLFNDEPPWWEAVFAWRVQ
jgi:hypothetical protein